MTKRPITIDITSHLTEEINKIFSSLDGYSNENIEELIEYLEFFDNPNFDCLTKILENYLSFLRGEFYL